MYRTVKYTCKRDATHGTAPNMKL